MATALPLGAAHGLGGGWQGPARPVWPAPCPPNWCCTAPMQRAANAARKNHSGLFCHLGGLPRPVLDFFLFFFKMRTRTQGVGPDRWPVLLQGLWWPIHIAPQACSFGVWGGMGLRPGPHACLLPPWWLTLAHHGLPVHPRCPLPCPLRQPPKPHLAQAAAQPAPAVAGTGAAAHRPPPGRNAVPR